MLETPDVPPIARVMRVAPRPGEQPAAGFSWGDYEDVDESRVTADDADSEDEGGWIVKGSNRRPSMCSRHIASQLCCANTHSTRAEPKASSSQIAPQTAPETMTKKKRQNMVCLR